MNAINQIKCPKCNCKRFHLITKCYFEDDGNVSDSGIKLVGDGLICVECKHEFDPKKEEVAKL